MASPSELSLECKPQSYSMLLKSFADQQAPPSADPASKLEDFLARLEEERLKIDAFKRELPLCMQLLTNAVEASRQQLQAYAANQGPRPVLEEFIPLKNSGSEGTEQTSNTTTDKANWMTSAQLWSQASDVTKQQSTATSPPKETDIGFNVSPKLTLENKPRNGGAFLPFSKDRNSSTNLTFRPALPELALASNERDMEDKKYTETGNGIACTRRSDNNSSTNNGSNIINGMVIEQAKATGISPEGQAPNSTTAANNATGATNPQTHRKARRCWSPDLHRRFVNALQMLGGSQVATPKQIRELMKVDGLTNDEVKSHLQKYRLHTRRPSPSPQVAGAPAPQLVVLGGIWVPPEYAAAAAHGGAQAALYGAHPITHAPAHYCAAPTVSAQEFYAAAAAGGAAPPPTHHEIHHRPLQHQLHVYKAASQTHSSPESGMRGAGGGDRSESIEDGKSESSSWKGDSGENGGERSKGLSGLRDENEESNGSEITLKF